VQVLLRSQHVASIKRVHNSGWGIYCKVYIDCDVLSYESYIQNFTDLKTQILYFCNADTLKDESKHNCEKVYERNIVERQIGEMLSEKEDRRKQRKN
jgi:hypothetical protein